MRSDRRYRFALPPGELWVALSAVDRYRQWWPWLRQLDGGAFEAGAAWDCVVQPPLPYTLRFNLVLEEVDAPRLAVAAITGDIVGTARLELTGDDAGSGTEVRLESSLAPGNGVLKLVAAVASPLVRFGHDWVLDTGARQFRAGLA